MALLTLDELKDRLFIDHADDDDGLNLIITTVGADLEMYLNCKLGVDSDIVEYHDGGGENLIIAQSPISSVSSIVDTFDDNAVVSTSLYEVLADQGVIRKLNDLGLQGNWLSGVRRYKVTYDGGLADDGTNNKLKSIALDLAVNKYRQSDPGAISEQSGDHKYTREQGIPKEIQRKINRLKEFTF